MYPSEELDIRIPNMKDARKAGGNHPCKELEAMRKRADTSSWEGVKNNRKDSKSENNVGAEYKDGLNPRTHWASKGNGWSWVDWSWHDWSWEKKT